MSRLTNKTGTLLFLLFISVIAGCSDPNKLSYINPATGKHLTNWSADHAEAFQTHPDQCSDCHGTDLTGGSSKVSCFSDSVEGISCHATGPSGHTPDWAKADSHGAAAKAAPGPSGGSALCQKCHGDSLTGGESQKSCMNTAGCHGEGVKAPHSPAPWRGDGRTHATTDSGNAAVCAICHLNDRTPPTYALVPSGAKPGCFNNTLCHGSIGHAAGWANPDSHGASAKAAPGSTGFASCKTCHGSGFTGGVQQSCLNTSGCHGATVGAPHSPAPWRGGSRTHTTTDAGNASVCALCHEMGANSTVQPASPAPSGTTPGCFNATLCHGTTGHEAGWADPGSHGVQAEQGFSVCTACHGTDYKGGSAAVSCYQCHGGPGLDHPAASWVIPNHKTAALAGNTACKACHGADFSGGGSGVACTSCHMENETRAHMTGWYPDVFTNHRAYALTNGTAACANASCHGENLTGVDQGGPSCSTCHSWPIAQASCGSCHGIPPDGSGAPNRAGAHAAHIALGASITCSTCHGGAGAGTGKHQDGTVDVSIDAVYNGKGGAASFNSTAKTCSNVSCHGGPRSSPTTLTSTPSWLTGVIDVYSTNPNQCASCHVRGTSAGNPEANSNYSGKHSFHSSRATCTQCHDTNKLAAGHFTGLNTAAFETPASDTLLNSLNYNAGAKTCDPSCHGLKSW